MPSAPESGQAYPITLGSTLKNESEKGSKEYVSLRYTFRPNTVSRATTGILTLEHALQDNSQSKGANNPVKVCLSVSSVFRNLVVRIAFTCADFTWLALMMRMYRSIHSFQAFVMESCMLSPTGSIKTLNKMWTWFYCLMASPCVWNAWPRASLGCSKSL